MTMPGLLKSRPALPDNDLPAPVLADRRWQADNIVKNHVIAGLGLGLMPLPVVDIVIVIGLQLKMVRQLCALYGVSYSDKVARMAASSILGMLLPVKVTVLTASLLRVIPGFTSLISGSTSSITAGALIYAHGRMFTAHLESGGDLLNFQLRGAARDLYREFRQGLRILGGGRRAQRHRRLSARHRARRPRTA